MTFLLTKTEIRKNTLKKLNNFLGSHAANLAIIKRFEKLILLHFKLGDTIAAYYPTSYEADILPLLTKLSSQNFTILLPVINQNDKIDFYPWHPEHELIKSKYAKKILEPKTQIIPMVPNILIIPLTACDKNGHRIGSGKGMYDKYIASIKELGHKPLCIGLCYDFQLLDSITPDSHDQPLDIILTDKRFINHSPL